MLQTDPPLRPISVLLSAVVYFYRLNLVNSYAVPIGKLKILVFFNFVF